MHRVPDKILLLVFLATVVIAAAEEVTSSKEAMDPEGLTARSATALADRWFTIIESAKRERCIPIPYAEVMMHGALLGDEYTSITTTLGVLESKETALNAKFAGVFAKTLREAGIDSASVVGISISGSFPSLAISMFAALQTLGAQAVVVSSLGASEYGANQPMMTWIDIERILSERGGLQYQSAFTTRGGEADSGGGISQEGLAVMKDAASRNLMVLTIPRGMNDAIERRMQLFQSSKVSLVVNIGGNEAMLGSCSHAVGIPCGMISSLAPCRHSNRGVIARMLDEKIPVFHILNIRELAVRYGIPLGQSADK